MYFTDEYRTFFCELAQHNSRDWFQEHKQRYEEHAKRPFARLVGDVIAEIRLIDPSFVIEPWECIGRIHRDIRFSADKTPYNTHCIAFISPGGRRDKSVPGVYVRISADEIGVMGGAHAPSTKQLRGIRVRIAADSAAFRTLIEAPGFVAKFDGDGGAAGVRGAEHKRIPSEFKDAYEREPLIAKKQYYFVARRSASVITTDLLLPTIMEYWHAASPLNEYLTEAMGR